MVKIKRAWVQWLSAIAMNANIKGFIDGKIFKGVSKYGCVPGLNCYSCPGAFASCPIGSLQAVIGAAQYHISYYITGFLIAMGTLLGRFICGWLCPFGLIQELLHKLPSPKFKLPKWTTYSKYAVLIIFVVLLPMLWVNKFGLGSPTFCKYICPAGTLEGGIPLLILTPGLRQSIGTLFFAKMSILVITLITSILIFRPFCKTLCPLGAIYALFNKISFYQYTLDTEKCSQCGTCSKVCKMDVVPYEFPNDAECIRCGACKDICPTKAISTIKLSDPRKL